MTTTNWQPRAAKVTEVKTASVDTYNAAGTYVLTRNGKTVSVIAQGSVAATAAALVAAWNLSTEVELTEQTAANPSGGTITLTMDESGVPSGTCSLTVSGGGTVTNFSTTTAATGPYHADNAANWSNAANPTTEDVQIDLARGSMLYGLDSFAAGTLNSLYIFSASRTQNTIGLPELNAAGYVEDRAKRALKAATTTKIECDSPLIRWDYSNVANTTEVRKSGGLVQGVPSVLLAGSSASNVCETLVGSVGLGFYADESYVGTAARLSAQATVIQGPNSTVTTFTSIGTLEINGAFTTLNQEGGVSIVEGTATPTITLSGPCVCDYRAGSPTALTAGNGGTFMMDGDLTPITAGTVTINRGGKIVDKFRRLTITSLVRGSDVQELSAA